MVFGLPEVESLSNMENVLLCFSKVSGLLFNMSKSKIFYGSQVPGQIKGISSPASSLPVKYLVVPLHSKTNFQPIVDKLERR